MGDGERLDGEELRESQRITQVADVEDEAPAGHETGDLESGVRDPKTGSGRASVVVQSLPLEKVLPASDPQPTTIAAVLTKDQAFKIPAFLFEAATQPPVGQAAGVGEDARAGTTPRAYPEDWVVDGRYQVLEQVGAGGMARIFKVRHISLGREFALKLMHSSSTTTQRFRAHLLQEAHVISQMEHPQFVQVTDFGEDELFGVFIVMEYLKGETLHDLLRRKGRLRLPQALNIALQVGEALQYMHSKDLIHRDVKPENVFLVRAPEGRRQQPKVKIIDFGLTGRDAKVTVRGSGNTLGTPAYMSPEQIRGNRPRPGNDIYALGVLLFEMISGAPPFEGSFDQVLEGHVSETPKSLCQAVGELVDERVELMVQRALSKASDARHPTMGEFVYELRTVMDMLGIERRHDRRRQGREIDQPRRVAELTAGFMVFENSPCPMFQLDETCRVRAANPALGRFLRSSCKSLIGTSLAAGRLGQYYPELADDVLAVARQGAPHQRLLTIRRKTPRSTKVLVWLVPMGNPKSEVATVAGVVVPLSYDEEKSGGSKE